MVFFFIGGKGIHHTPDQHTILTHPITNASDTLYQTLLKRPINTPYRYILRSHRLNIPRQSTLSTHPDLSICPINLSLSIHPSIKVTTTAYISSYVRDTNLHSSCQPINTPYQYTHQSTLTTHPNQSIHPTLSICPSIKVTTTAYISSYVRDTNVIEAGNENYLVLVLWVAITIGRLAGVYDQRFLTNKSLPIHLSIFCVGGFLSMLLILWFPNNAEALWIGMLSSYVILSSTHPLNTPIDTPSEHALLTHPKHIPCKYALLTYAINAPTRPLYQHILRILHEYYYYYYYYYCCYYCF